MAEKKTMRAMKVTKLGKYEDALSFDSEYQRPEMKKGTELLVKVAACSLSPGDARRIRGDIDALWNPPTPFVPFMDICGTVVEAGPEATFNVGDCVFASDGSFVGGAAEYAVIDSSIALKKPEKLSEIEACTLANSVLRAMDTVEVAGIKGGERVLVIGASGGFGAHLVQFLKNAGVSYLAAISTQEELLKSLGVDTVVNYEEDGDSWWTTPEWEENPFDVIYDCVGGVEKWPKAKSTKILKKNREGLYFAIAMYEPVMFVHTKIGAVPLLASLLLMSVKNSICRWEPRYKQYLVDGKPKSEDLAKAVKVIEDGRLKVILDPRSPFPFTKEGAVDAINLMESRRANGKIVIKVE